MRELEANPGHGLDDGCEIVEYRENPYTDEHEAGVLEQAM